MGQIKHLVQQHPKLVWLVLMAAIFWSLTLPVYLRETGHDNWVHIRRGWPNGWLEYWHHRTQKLPDPGGFTSNLYVANKRHGFMHGSSQLSPLL